MRLLKYDSFGMNWGVQISTTTGRCIYTKRWNRMEQRKYCMIIPMISIESIMHLIHFMVWFLMYLIILKTVIHTFLVVAIVVICSILHDLFNESIFFSWVISLTIRDFIIISSHEMEMLKCFCYGMITILIVMLYANIFQMCSEHDI